MNVLFISNGHGEDVISRQIVIAFQLAHPQSSLYVMPLVGGGQIFSEMPAVNVLESRWNSPSGGFIGSISALMSEIKAGVLKAHYLQIREARFYHFDLVVAVGDFFSLIVARLLHAKHRVLISTAKSDLFERHFAIERWFIKRWARMVFTRDQVTADSLIADGVIAKYAGNVMMDLVKTKESRRKTNETKRFTLGVLPGSREEAYSNFDRIATVLAHSPKDWRVMIAAPPQLDLKRLKQHPFIQETVWGDFQSLLNQADMVMGLAGTANEQCVGMGIPVVAFVGSGPQTTKRRFVQQGKLLLGGVRLLKGLNSAIMAQQVLKCSKDKAWFASVYEKGPQIMGGPGASQRIVKELECIFES